MFQKRRSMLGRRHLLAQQPTQAQARPSAADTGGGGSGSGRGRSSSWRGQRSGKKKTPSHLDKSSKEFKKCLFSKSPGISYSNFRRMQSQDLYSSNENLLNETGISMMAPTPRSTPRNPVTPASLQRLRVEMEKTRYGPLPSTTRLTTKTVFESDKVAASSTSIMPVQTSYSNDLYSLKRPDSPGPSRLERILLEEKLAQTSSSHDFYNLKPPDSPPPSRLDKLILAEKLEQPLDPDLKKMQSLSLDEPNQHLQFSPPLSSTCISSPDSGKRNAKVKEEIKAATFGSGRKLSTIVEDCDVSVIEFELNERTMQDLDNTLMETTLNNTVRPKNVSILENILEDNNNKSSDESVSSWKSLVSRLDCMERAVMGRAEKHKKELKNLKEQIETLQKRIEKESLEDINNIRSVRKTVEYFIRSAPVHSIENKENNFTFKEPTCKKKQLDEESKWFNSVKKENPSLLKTPNPSRKINQSALLTPHSLSNVLHDQMNELYN